MAGVPAAVAHVPASLDLARGAEDRSLPLLREVASVDCTYEARGATISLHKGESGKRTFGAALADWER